MNLLLDTHVFLQYFMQPKKIRRSTFTTIEGGIGLIYISAASIWEITIKHALRKLTVPGELSQYVRHRMSEANFAELPIVIDHALSLRNLPPHHSDPFDRILIAQAQVEGLALVTHDKQIRKYEVRTLPA